MQCPRCKGDGLPCILCGGRDQSAITSAIEARDKQWCEAILIPEVTTEVRAAILARITGRQ